MGHSTSGPRQDLSILVDCALYSVSCKGFDMFVVALKKNCLDALNNYLDFITQDHSLGFRSGGVEYFPSVF